MPKNLDVVGLGNALMDVVVMIPSNDIIDRHGLTVGVMHPVDNQRWQEIYDDIGDLSKDIQTGGSCANTIASLGLLGANVSYCSQVGNDTFGMMYKQQFQDACGRHHLLTSHTVATGKCLSLVDKDAERTMLTDLGAAVALDSIDHYKEAVAQAKVLYLTGYLMLGEESTQHMLNLIAVAKENGTKVGFDVADPFVIDIVKDQMFELIKEHVDIIFLNEKESVALCGGTPESALEMLQGFCEIVVVKLGGKGSMACRGDERVTADIYPANLIDTTGAGDSYASGFLYGYVNDWTLIHSVKLGSKIASKVVSQTGAVLRDSSMLAQCVSEVLSE